MKFHIKKSEDLEQPWYFTIENKGNVLCHSETYNNFEDVLAIVHSIKKNAPNAEIISPDSPKKK